MNRLDQWLAFLEIILKVWVPIGGLLYTLYHMYKKWLDHKVELAKQSSLAGEVGIKLTKLCEEIDNRLKGFDTNLKHHTEQIMENKVNINTISQAVGELRASHVKDLQIQLENIQRGNRS